MLSRTSAGVGFAESAKRDGWNLTKTTTIPRIRVTPELKATLECLAKTDGRTLSDYVRRALEQHAYCEETLEMVRRIEQPARSVECFEELATTGMFQFPTIDSDKDFFGSIETKGRDDDD